jgi:hypothetical protein
MDEYTKELIEGARVTYHDVVAGKDRQPPQLLRR